MPVIGLVTGVSARRQWDQAAALKDEVAKTKSRGLNDLSELIIVSPIGWGIGGWLLLKNYCVSTINS